MMDEMRISDRELDVLIATKIMRWWNCNGTWCKEGTARASNTKYNRFNEWSPSTSLDHAALAEAEIARRGLARRYGHELALVIGCFESGIDSRDVWFILATANPRARCEAMLKAIQGNRE